MNRIVTTSLILLIACVGSFFVDICSKNSLNEFKLPNQSIYTEYSETNFLSGELYSMNRADEFNLSDYDIYLEEFTRDIVLGEIKSESIAVIKAEDIFKEVYGESIENKKPYIVSDDKEHDAWYIEGTLPDYYVGGVPNIIIRGEDGKVLALWHTK